MLDGLFSLFRVAFLPIDPLQGIILHLFDTYANLTSQKIQEETKKGPNLCF